MKYKRVVDCIKNTIKAPKILSSLLGSSAIENKRNTTNVEVVNNVDIEFTKMKRY